MVGVPQGTPQFAKPRVSAIFVKSSVEMLSSYFTINYIGII